MSSLLISSLARRPVRHRGFWHRPQRRPDLSQAQLVIWLIYRNIWSWEL